MDNSDTLSTHSDNKINETSHDAISMKELIEAMKTVDLNSPEARLNVSSISDGKGGRILL